MSVRQKVLFSLLGLLTGLTLTTVWTAVAQPVPGYQKALIPYQGVLKRDGAPITALGEEALPVKYRFFDGPGEDAREIYSQTLETEVSEGRFTVGFGPVDDQGRLVAEMVRDYDHVYMELEVEGEVITGRQKVLATPYLMAASSASDLLVTGNLQVGGDLDVGGDVAIGGDITQVGAITAFTVNSTDVNATSVNTTGITAQSGTITALNAPTLTSNNITTANVNAYSGDIDYLSSYQINANNIYTGSINSNNISSNNINASTISTPNLIANNLVVNGSGTTGFLRTENFNDVRAVNLPSVNTHFCALAEVRIGDDNDEDDVTRCIVYNASGTWRLELRTTANESDSSCSATCFRFR